MLSAFCPLFLFSQVLLMSYLAIGETLVWTPEYSKYSKVGAAHLFALLKKKPTMDSCSQAGRKLDTCKGNLEFQEVSFFYPCRPEVPILRDLSLISIKKGKTVAFGRSSGCGKSTCVQLLQRFYDPMKGQVLLDGVDVRELNVQWLRSQTAVVSQEPVLFNCSIAENIAYGDRSRMVPLEEIKEVADAANIHSFIEGIPRVVQHALEKARRGRTCLVVAHRLSTVQNADLIIVLQNGKIKEQGTHEELLRDRDTYFGLVAAQGMHRSYQPCMHFDLYVM